MKKREDDTKTALKGEVKFFTAPPITLTLLIPQFPWPELFTAEKMGHF